MQYNSEELNEILRIFKVEAEEIIQGLNDGIMLLEKNIQDKTINYLHFYLRIF